MTTNLNKISLSLSGGGYRAILFHVGALYRLNELGLLSKLDAISAVSGGAIVTGVLGTNWDKLDFDANGVATNFTDLILNPLWNFCDKNLDVLAVLLGFVSGSHYLEYHYNKLFDKKLIKDLPDHPEFIFNSTNLETGSNCRFSQKGMHLYSFGQDPNLTDILIAKVVAASSAFPPWLASVTIKPNHFKFNTPVYSLLRKHTLVDGGTYDNLGVHAVNDYTVKLISDAGSPIKPMTTTFWSQFWSNRLSRPVSISLDYNSRLLYRIALTKMLTGLNTGAMWVLKHSIHDYPRYADLSFNIDPKWEIYLRNIPTRLKKLSDYDKGHLINMGYIVSDLSVRSYYLKDAPMPNQLPLPDYDFNRPPILG